VGTRKWCSERATHPAWCYIIKKQNTTVRFARYRVTQEQGLASFYTMAAYSRESTVKAIRLYYAFLCAKIGAIRPLCIIEPPVGGWRNITVSSLASLEKTDEVVELLRHLPYIKGDSNLGWNEKIAPETDAFQYGGSGDAFANVAPHEMWPPGAGEIPAHVAVLTNGARYGSWLLLDTIEGRLDRLLDFKFML
jgi:hypothetical protein